MSSTRRTLSQRFKQFFSALKSFTFKKSRHKHRYPEPIVDRPEEYLAGHEWDLQDPGGRYASVADLCARVGYQLPLQVVKLIARDVLRELEDLHEARGIAHSDLNASNILLSPRDMRSLVSQLSADTQESFSPSGLSLDAVLLDFNSMLTSTSSTVFKLSRVDLDSFGLRGLSDGRALRAPEDILGAPHGPSADLWILGCILYELLAGEPLFDPSFQTQDLGLSLEESHLIQIIELLGPFPTEVLAVGEYSKRWFKEDGTLRIDTTLYPVSLETVLRLHVDEDELVNTNSFLSTLLQINPDGRAKLHDIINHPWFTN